MIKINFNDQGILERVRYRGINAGLYEDVLDCVLPGGVAFPRNIVDDVDGYKRWVIQLLFNYGPNIFVRIDDCSMVLRAGVDTDAIKMLLLNFVVEYRLFLGVTVTGVVNGRDKHIVFRHNALVGFSRFHHENGSTFVMFQ